MADPFEEFEFKPLTEGLGFNKKSDQLKNEIKSTLASSNASAHQAAPSRSSIFPENAKAAAQSDRAATKSFGLPAASTGAGRTTTESSRAASQSISELMASLPPSLDFLDDKQDLTRRSEMPFGSTSLATPATPSNRPQIYQPLGQTSGQSSISSGPTVGSVLPAPGTKAGSAAAAIVAASTTHAGYRERMAETYSRTTPVSETTTAKAAALSEGLVPVAASFSAGLIDAMVVAGISTILLVCIITITHINLVAMLTNASTDSSTQKNLVFLFFAVLQMYLLVSRAFFGASLGEWAFELQLGTAEQNRKLYYPLQVLWRTLVITATGVFAIPLLSFAFGRDLARYLCGLQLYRRI
jgi:hypothetical protein